MYTPNALKIYFIYLYFIIRKGCHYANIPQHYGLSGPRKKS